MEIIREADIAREENVLSRYATLLRQHPGKRILIVGHEVTFAPLRAHYYQQEKTPKITPRECIILPSYILHNELDKWIISALHDMGLQLEAAMDAYLLDE